MIVVLVLLGQVLELRARSRTEHRDPELLGLAPKTARTIDADGTEQDVPLEHVHVGDRLRVRPGERVPVDGVVLEGATHGRRIDGHRRADPGREDAGSDGHRRHGERHRHVRDARRERVGSDTLLAQIVRMVERGAAIARADSAAGRHGLRLVRAGRHRGRGRHVRRLGDWSVRSRGSRTRW